MYLGDGKFYYERMRDYVCISYNHHSSVGVQSKPAWAGETQAGLFSPVNNEAQQGGDQAGDGVQCSQRRGSGWALRQQEG